jgi:hypothetical protein
MPLPDNAMRVAKIVEDEQLVFGWASVSMTKDDLLVVDSHGDVIEPEELERAAYEFMLTSRQSGERHEGESVADVVESVFIDAKKAQAMGIDAPHTGWWIGVKIEDPEVFAKVKSGEYEMFSVEGTAIVEDVEYEGMTVIDKQYANDVFRQLRDAGNERWGGKDTYVFVDDFDLDTPQAVFCIGREGEETMIGVTFERMQDGSVVLGADEAEVERHTVYATKPAAQAY